MLKKLLAVLALAAFVAVPAWFVVRAGGASGPAGPRPARPGEDPCAVCLMLVSDVHFAAERVGGDDPKLYDDGGCLLRELATGDRSGALYFADAQTGEWIPAAEVRFEPTNRPTPMGYGLAAGRSGTLDLESAVRRVQDAAKEKN